MSELPHELSITEAQACLTELAEDVAARGVEQVLTKDGVAYMALISMRKLDYYRALELEHERLVLADDALKGLNDLADGNVLDEAELDRTLAAVRDKRGNKA